MRHTVLITILCLLLPLQAKTVSANEMQIGLRGGCDKEKNNLHEHYAAAELYILKEFPRKVSLGEQAALSGRFDLGATYLKGSDDRGGMLAAGGDLVLGLWQGHLEFEIGFRPTWMFRHTYGEDNFGGGLQFTSHAGLAISLHNLVLNYRLQHTSNAGLYEDNPGLNLHMIGLGYRF